MDLIRIYECFCDRTRLRILNLLHSGPLCVCHLQEVLGEPQVKVSRHLAYLRHRRLVEASRSGHWMIYRLPRRPSTELRTNLACLQDCAQENDAFRRDRSKLERVRRTLDAKGPLCCPSSLPGPAPIPKQRSAPNSATRAPRPASARRS